MSSNQPPNYCMACRDTHPGLTCDENAAKRVEQFKQRSEFKPSTRPSIKRICDLPEGQEVKGMVLFNDNVIVATTLGVWRLEDDELVPIKFQPLPEPLVMKSPDVRKD